MPDKDETVRLCREEPRHCRWDAEKGSVSTSLADIKATLGDIQADLRVGQQRFRVLENIVFGAASIIGVAFLGGLVALVLNKGA
jgi:hypothetical protein